LQIGQSVYLNHSARVSEQLGQIRFEPIDKRRGWDFEPIALLGLQSAAFLLHTYLPDHEPIPGLYEAFGTFGQFLDQAEIWPFLYIKLELGLLDALGFGLDLRSCAVTGLTDDLIYVSPRSGRAVSQDAGRAYHDKLLPLPAFLGASKPQSYQDEIEKGLRLTTAFLDKHLFGPMNRPSPPIRDEMIRSLLRKNAI